MSLKSILFAGSAFVSLMAFAAPVQAAPHYDSQYDETRELNLLQLDNPGDGVDAVPGYQIAGYDDDDDNGDYGDYYRGHWNDWDDDDDDTVYDHWPYGDHHNDNDDDDDDNGWGDDDD